MKFLVLFLGIFWASFGEITRDFAMDLYLDAISKNGNMEKALKSEKAFLELEEKHPSFFNRVRLASLLALKAKFSTLKKLHFVNQSINAFESLEPEALKTTNLVDKYEFHLFRGRTFSQLPSLFGKKSIARQDIENAISMLETSEISRDSAEVARLFLSYSIMLKEDGEAEKSKVFAKKAISFEKLEDDDKVLAIKLAG